MVRHGSAISWFVAELWRLERTANIVSIFYGGPFCDEMTPYNGEFKACCSFNITVLKAEPAQDAATATASTSSSRVIPALIALCACFNVQGLLSPPDMRYQHLLPFFPAAMIASS